MKKKFLISITLLFFCLVVEAQEVTENNIMSYVSETYDKGTKDKYTEYFVRFTDDEYGYFYYDNDDGKYYDTRPTLLRIQIGKTKKQAIYWIWKQIH